MRRICSPSAPIFFTSDAIDPHGMYSSRMFSESAVTSVPRYFTMFSWCRPRIMSTSARKLFSSFESSSSRTIGIVFTASSFPVSTFIPRYTVPYAPLPIAFPFCQLIATFSSSFTLGGGRSYLRASSFV